MNTENKIVAISDIHGHYDEMMALMDKVVNEWDVDFSKDKIVWLGDYCDGGYKTRQVITQLMKWQKMYPHWVFLKGNHDEMMLLAENQLHHSEIFEHWYRQGGKSTALSYVPKKKLPQYLFSRHATEFIYSTHMRWLDSLPLFEKIDDYLFVHAGIDPELELQTSESQMMWIREPFLSNQKDYGYKIIFGHTTFDDPLIHDNKIGIDTMFLNKGKLTALLLPEEKFIFQESLTDDNYDWNNVFNL